MVPTSPPPSAQPEKRDLLLDEDYEEDDDDTAHGHFQPVDQLGEAPDVGSSFFGLGDEFEGGEYQFYEEQSEHDGKEAGWRKFPMYVLFILMALGNGALLGYSMFQLSQHQRTTDKSEIHCNAQGWAQHRPIALKFVGDPETLKCTWNAINSVIRMCCCMAGMMLAFVPMYGVMQNRRVVIVASIALSTVVSTGYFISMMMDANDVRVSTNWCLGSDSKGNWLSDVVWKPKPTQPPLCLNDQYDLTCICDAIGLFAWGGMAFFLFQFDRRSQKRKILPAPATTAAAAV